MRLNAGKEHTLSAGDAYSICTWMMVGDYAQRDLPVNNGLEQLLSLALAL